MSRQISSYPNPDLCWFVRPEVPYRAVDCCTAIFPDSSAPNDPIYLSIRLATSRQSMTEMEFVILAGCKKG
jgi:hypothetical protein